MLFTYKSVSYGDREGTQSCLVFVLVSHVPNKHDHPGGQIQHMLLAHWRQAVLLLLLLPLLYFRVH